MTVIPPHTRPPALRLRHGLTNDHSIAEGAGSKPARDAALTSAAAQVKPFRQSTLMTAPDPLRPSELATLAAYGDGLSASPLSERPYLICRPERGLAPGEASRTAAWLRQRPCPVIGVANPEVTDTILARACDVVLEAGWTLDTLLSSIAGAPLAAMVLVQVLRATERLSVADALIVESLGFAALQNGPEFKAWLAKRPPTASAPSGRGGPLKISREGGRLEIVLDRPDARNSVDRTLRDALVEALELAQADETIAEVALSASGKCFSIGGELDEFGTTPDPTTAHMIRALRSPAMALSRVADRLSVRVHGVSIGAGVELAAFAGKVIAEPNASFQLPELSMGLIPGAGGCVSIPLRIGRQRAALLALSGRRISAATALQWGLVDAVEA
jgi:enoyl-CoA hydratase